MIRVIRIIPPLTPPKLGGELSSRLDHQYLKLDNYKTDIWRAI